MAEAMKEVKVPEGEFYSTPNGNVYLKIGPGHCVYICNLDMNRVPWQDCLTAVSVHADCTVQPWRKIKRLLKA